MTRPEAMEQVTVLLNKARGTRKFAYDMWGEDSAHKIWDTEIALYEYLLAELGGSDGSGVAVVLDGVVLTSETPAAGTTSLPEAAPIHP